MNVTACLVTDGKHDMLPVLDSLPPEWQRVVWDNGAQRVTVFYDDEGLGAEIHRIPCEDLSVYGRYAAIEYATNDLIYVQDDDVIVSDPQQIVLAWGMIVGRTPWQAKYDEDGVVVCNMPQEFLPHYPDSALVGFGAVFHRDTPVRAFDRMLRGGIDFGLESLNGGLGSPDRWMLRECDRVFTCLTPRVLVDIPKQDREFASDPDRLWKQPGHSESTARMLELARSVRDA